MYLSKWVRKLRRYLISVTNPALLVEWNIFLLLSLDKTVEKWGWTIAYFLCNISLVGPFICDYRSPGQRQTLLCWDSNLLLNPGNGDRLGPSQELLFYSIYLLLFGFVLTVIKSVNYSNNLRLGFFWVTLYWRLRHFVQELTSLDLLCLVWYLCIHISIMCRRMNSRTWNSHYVIITFSGLLPCGFLCPSAKKKCLCLIVGDWLKPLSPSNKLLGWKRLSYHLCAW